MGTTWDGEAEPRAAAVGSVHPDSAAMGADDLAAYRESQAAPAGIAAARLIGAIESIEDPFGIGRGYTGAGILHAYDQLGTFHDLVYA